MPARMPISSEIGTITTSTQNIRMPVAPSAGNSFDATVVLNLVEQPKSPCEHAGEFRLDRVVAEGEAGAGAPVAGSMIGCFGQTPSHWP